MLFSALLMSAGLDDVQPTGDAEVTAVCSDSRRCGPGACFVAVRGSVADGHKFIRSAMSAGAVGIVCEDASAVPEGAAFAVADDAREALGPLAQAIRGWPGRKLTNVAVTGTNGKTTTTFLVRRILETAGFSPAMLGTITYETGRRTTAAGVTTPDPVALAEMTAEMVAAGKTHLVMEVSSHALDQRRTCGLEFRVAAFTNLSGDHLDYHGTMDEYFRAKRRLFESLGPDAHAVINRDDPGADAVAEATRAKVLWYGLSPAADVRGRIERIDSTGSRFRLIHGSGQQDVSTGLIGRHNVYNCLAAAGVCIALGVELPAIASALGSAGDVPGRLERVGADAPYRVFVDYAHTDDALKNVLASLRPITSGRIILVFGCGGDRDRTKRPRMAKTAGDLADRIVVTSDNPRGEDPQEIIRQIVAGFDQDARRRVDVEPDRRLAIRTAINLAGPGDVVLIAGKGHEHYQVVGGRRVHFDDVETAGELVRRRERHSCSR